MLNGIKTFGTVSYTYFGVEENDLLCSIENLCRIKQPGAEQSADKT